MKPSKQKNIIGIFPKVNKSKKVTDLYAKITCIKILNDDIILFVKMIILLQM